MFLFVVSFVFFLQLFSQFVLFTIFVQKWLFAFGDFCKYFLEYVFSSFLFLLCVSFQV